METEVKQRNQRNRRRERAQRMQAQRESKVKDGDSGEDESPAREKPPRPSVRRKRSKEPLGEEDIIDGFAIMAFRTYEDLEAAVKCASSPRTTSLSTKPRLPVSESPRRHPSTVTSVTLLQDAGTSDDSGRASERLTGSSVAPRDPDSSRDRLSDASSRCSSGKGYICDSEGDEDKASPENSRNASPKYHDASMEDASEANALFRVTGAGGVTVAGGVTGAGAGAGGGAVALSCAPLGGSASPAPAPLPQPAPSPAPAALPPPALPPPPLRADTPHRPGAAHIPSLDSQAATQVPRPLTGPATPERPAHSKLQPGARAAADSPTPAPPAPPAPSPLFPSHAAYQAHAADYRHTNHEARTEGGPPVPPAAPLAATGTAAVPASATAAAAPPPAAPLDLHARPVPKPHPHPPPASLTSRAPAPLAPPSLPTSAPQQPLLGRPPSPVGPVPRPYPAPTIGSSHVNSTLSSSIPNHALAYHSHASLQKHSLQSAYAGRPPHLSPFSVANHLSSNHIQASLANQPSAPHLGHPINSHSMMNHAGHLPFHPSSSVPSAPNHMLPLMSTGAPTIPNYTPSIKHPGLSLPPHSGPFMPPVSLHAPAHADASTPAIVTSTASNGALPLSTAADSRQPPSDSKQPVLDSRQAQPVIESRPPAESRLPSTTDVPRSEATPLATNGYPPPAVYPGAYPPLYAPYATTLQHSPYLPAAAASPRNATDTRTSLSSSPLVAPKTPKGVRPHTPGSTGAAGAPLSYSPHGQSPSRERESFSNISSLSRSTPAAGANAATGAGASAPAVVSSLTAPLAAPLTTPMAAPLATSLVPGLPTPLTTPLTTPLAAPTPTPAAPSAPHLAHSLAPVPTIPSISSSAKPPAHWGVTRATAPERPAGFAPAPPLFAAPLAPPNPNPFSAESLFQSSPGADLLRRELDNRFLAAAGAATAGAPGVGVGLTRTELHHHQHQHTHVHQHPPSAPPHHPPHHHQLLMPHAPLFKDVGKMPSLYRTGLGLGYPYSSSLLHPTAPYVPPAPLTTYAPKPVVSSASDPATKPPPRPAVAKTGKWNAMHVRIAWEIYNHQQKEKAGSAGADKDKLRAFPAPAPAPAPPPPYRSPYDLPPAPYLPHHPHLGVSPFARYGAGAFPSSPFGLAYGRELALSSSLHGVHHAPLLHDAWRLRAPVPPTSHAPSHVTSHASHVAAAEARRDQEERERARREREERERRERDDRERRKQREREMERVRARSPLRNGAADAAKRHAPDERKEPPRPPPPPLAAYPPPPWDPYRAFDPLQHMRFAPIVEAAIRAEEDRAKMLSAYAHHPQLKASPLLHRPLPPHGPLPPLGVGAHAPLAPLPPMAPPLAPLAPLDLLKKEEPR